MIRRIIRFSAEQRWVVLTCALVLLGIAVLGFAAAPLTADSVKLGLAMTVTVTLDVLLLIPAGVWIFRRVADDVADSIDRSV